MDLLQRSTPSGTTVVPTERFRGPFGRALPASLDIGTMAGFEAVNAALEVRAESLARSAP